MKNIKDKLIAILEDRAFTSDEKIVVDCAQDGVLRCTFVCMYGDDLSLTFAKMKEISDLLQTEAIDFGDKDYQSGCESCDYGSRTEIEISATKVPEEILAQFR